MLQSLKYIFLYLKIVIQNLRLPPYWKIMRDYQSIHHTVKFDPSILKSLGLDPSLLWYYIRRNVISSISAPHPVDVLWLVNFVFQAFPDHKGLPRATGGAN